MPRVTITREVHFSAAHRVFNPEWSDERNFEVFGACANPNWHGHDYVLYVAVEADLDRDTGFVMDFKDLKSIVESRVVDDMDHKNVNLDVPWMEGLIASAENIVVDLGPARRPPARRCEARQAHALGDAPPLRGVLR